MKQGNLRLFLELGSVCIASPELNPIFAAAILQTNRKRETVFEIMAGSQNYNKDLATVVSELVDQSLELFADQSQELAAAFRKR